MASPATIAPLLRPNSQRRRSRVAPIARTIAMGLMALALVVLIFVSWLWWAGNQPSSLAWAIGQAQRWLPTDVQLVARDVNGSVLQGGTIGSLRWQSPDATVEISQLSAHWDWTALLHRHVLLKQLQAENVHVVTTPSADNTAPEPLQRLTLPVLVTAPLKINILTIETNQTTAANTAINPATHAHRAGEPLTVRHIDTQYSFDGSQHHIKLHQLDFAQGRYSGEATVQATAPLALQAKASAKVSTTVPGTATPAHIQATAQLQGWLGDAYMPWEVTAQLRSAPNQDAPVSQAQSGAAASSGGTLKTDIQARLLPWSLQPLVQVEASLQSFNAADWWPGAPITALSGTAQAMPANAATPAIDTSAAAKSPATPLEPLAPHATITATTSPANTLALDIQAKLRNAVPGPWDTAHLPIADLQAQARLDGTRWTLAPSSISLATPASQAGRMQVQGQYDTATGYAQAKITLEQILPPALHTALRASALSGSIQAQTLAATEASAAQSNSPKQATQPPAQTTTVATQLPISFAVDIEAANSSRQTIAANPLQIQKIKANGQWQALTANGTLQLKNLSILALQARVVSQQLRWSGVQGNAQLWDTKGDIQLTVPGLTAKVDGHISQAAGQGEVSIRIQQPDAVQQWLQTVQKQVARLWEDQPQWIPAELITTSLHGNAHLQAHWKGGWRSMVQAANTPTASTTPLSVQATLDIPEWRMGAAAQATPVGAPPTHAAPAPHLPALHLQGLRLTLEATPRNITSSVAGKITIGGGDGPSRQAGAASHIQLQSGMTATQSQPGLWRGRVAATQIKLQLPIAGQQPAWQINLPETTTLEAQFSTPADNNPAMLVRAELGSGQLHATMMGSANNRPVIVQWQPARWQRNASPAQGKAGASSTGAKARWSTQGSLQGLPLIWLDALGLPAPESDTATNSAPSTTVPKAVKKSHLAQWGIGGDVLFDGQWNAAMGETLSASASIRRASGDLRLYYGAITNLPESLKAAYNGSPAGIEKAEASLNLQNNTLQAQLQWRSARAGEVTAQLQLQTNLQQRLVALTRQPNTKPTPRAPADAVEPPWWDSNAPLTGNVNARLPDIGIWSALAPPGWRVRGTMVAQLQLSGTLSKPQWQGDISADDLAMRSVADGLDLQGGQLRASLQGTKLTINALELRGGPGSSLRILGPSGNRTAPPKDGGVLRGSGTVQWGASTQGETGTTGIRMQLTAQAEHLKILVRADRQASVSGDLQVQLQQGQFKLRGNLNVDRASILLPDETAPTLGDDVVVRSCWPDPLVSDPPPTQPRTSSARSQALPTQAPDIAINLNLGDDFALQGHGITTRLAGQLRIQSNANNTSPEVTGEIKTVQGRYRAWGQLLDVETGLARFNGPYDNPALDILALRAQSNERVGVQISGTAQRPQVRLYSDPVRPDAEVLSLLVLGRTSANGGLQAGLLQQAAMALLGGKTNGTSTKIASRLGLDEIGLVGLGSGDDANSAALSVGKRLTKDLYVTYEQSLTSTLGTLYVFYELSRKLTLRGQTGVRDAVDIVYTMRYD